jgi:hypothetical protein
MAKSANAPTPSASQIQLLATQFIAVFLLLAEPSSLVIASVSSTRSRTCASDD